MADQQVQPVKVVFDWPDGASDEVGMISVIEQVFERLQPDERQRVAQWTASRYGK